MLQFLIAFCGSGGFKQRQKQSITATKLEAFQTDGMLPCGISMTCKCSSTLRVGPDAEFL